MRILISVFTLLAITFQTSSGQSKKCDVETVLFTRSNAGQLNQGNIRDFLQTFSKECENNIEFEEFSNEVLFLVLDKQTRLVLTTIEKEKRQIELNEILSILSSPVNDGIDVKGLIPKVESAKFDGRLKKQVLDSLKVALSKI